MKLHSDDNSGINSLLETARLLEDFRNAANETINPAFEEIVRRGSGVRELLHHPAFGPTQIYGPIALARAIKALADPRAAIEGLAKALSNPRSQQAWELAFDVCAVPELCERSITEPLGIALVKEIQNLDNLDTRIQDNAAYAIIRRKLSEPLVVKSLVRALDNMNYSVVVKVMDVLGALKPSTDIVIDGLLSRTEDVQSVLCAHAIDTFRLIRLFNPKVIASVHRVLNSEFHFSTDDPDYKNDLSSWYDRSDQAEKVWSQNREWARSFLLALPVDALLARAKDDAESAPLSDEDRQILGWFKSVDLGEYRTSLQVYWCIGVIEKDAMKNASLATGWKKLERSLLALEASHGGVLLPVSQSHIRDCLLPNIQTLFLCEPFRSEAFNDKKTVRLRVDQRQGKRKVSQWTMRAWEGWKLIDRYLTLSELLPTTARAIK